MNRTFREDLEREVVDLEFAQEFGAAAAKSELALTLARARRIASYTQKDLARSLGTNQSYIAKLEAGDANPTIGRIGKILATLGLRLSTKAVALIFNPEPTIDIKSHPLEEANILNYEWTGEKSEIVVSSPRSSVGDCTPVRVQ